VVIDVWSRRVVEAGRPETEGAGAERVTCARRQDLCPRSIRNPEGPEISLDDGGVQVFRMVIERNMRQGVTLLSSYVSERIIRTFFVFDAPSPPAILSTAAANALPVDEITQVRILDAYYHRTCR
jgi:hypothetical protein